MSSFPVLFGASALVAALLASLALWSRRRVAAKLLALGLTALFLGSHYAALTDLLSRPKPLALALDKPTPENSSVVAAQMVEGEAIYLWMAREGLSEPRAFSLPWDEEMARQLHEAQREAEQGGGQVRMRKEGQQNAGAEGERIFYADPQRSPPPKQVSSTQ